jgi:hypothetical protein
MSKKIKTIEMLLLICLKDDVTMINEEEIPLPEKPEPRKRDEIRTTILTKYQNAIRPPGRYLT